MNFLSTGWSLEDAHPDAATLALAALTTAPISTAGDGSRFGDWHRSAFTTVAGQTRHQQHTWKIRFNCRCLILLSFPKASRHYTSSTHLQSERNHSADKTPLAWQKSFTSCINSGYDPQHGHGSADTIPQQPNICACHATARGAAELAALQPAPCLRGKHRAAETHPLGTRKKLMVLRGLPNHPHEATLSGPWVARGFGFELRHVAQRQDPTKPALPAPSHSTPLIES